MKLKNSYILLIAMTIFLLISIGSVCAHEDIGQDNDVQLSSADSDIVFSVDDDVTSADGGNNEDTQEKINTTVNTDNEEYKYKDSYVDKNITVEVKDNNSNPLTITKENLTVTEKGENVSFDYNNTNITIKGALNVGEHNLTITYLGNAQYNSSSHWIILKIFTNNTLNVPETANYNGESVEIPINLTDGIDDNTGLINNSNTQITFGENNAIISDWNINGNKLIINNLAEVPTTLTINYTENGNSIIKKVKILYDTKVNVDPTTMDINEGENATFIINVTGVGGSVINITAGNLTVKGATGATTRYNATSGNHTIVGLKKGVYNITITFKGNDINGTSKANIIVNVRGAVEINTNGTAINVNSTKKGEIQIINITNGVDCFDFNKDNITLNVTYKDGNATKTITVENYSIINNTIYFELENGNFTTANMTISFNHDEAKKTITLNRIYNAAIQANVTVNEFKDGAFTFILVDLDDNNATLSNRKITLYLMGNIRTGFSATTDENGTASFKTKNLYIYDQSGGSLSMKELEVGNHSVEISTEGNVKTTTLKINLTITQANITIVIDPYNEYYGSDKNVTITVTNTKSGEGVSGIILKLDMPQTSGKTYYVQTDANGTAKISAKNLISGTYDLTVSNNDTKNLNGTPAKSQVIINKIPVVISTPNVSIYYNSGTTSTITVKDKSGKAVSGMYLLVRLYTTSTKYTDYLFQTNSKGQVAFSAALNVGKHKIIVNSADNRYSAGQVTKTITVKKASAKLTAKKVTTYYKGGKYFTIKLTNTKNKKAIYNAQVNIKIYISKTKYYNYNGRTGLNGQLKLLVDLKPGKYKVVVSGAESKNYAAKQVTSKIVVKKAPTKLTPKKLTAKKGAKKYFKVKVTNKKTKKVIPKIKIKVKVYTGKKAKTYTLKTNAKGIAKLNVKKLKVGKHKVIVSSANKYCVAKKAKSTIKIKK